MSASDRHCAQVLLTMALYLRDGGELDLANFLVRLIPDQRLSSLRLEAPDPPVAREYSRQHHGDYVEDDNRFSGL